MYLGPHYDRTYDVSFREAVKNYVIDHGINFNSQITRSGRQTLEKKRGHVFEERGNGNKQSNVGNSLIVTRIKPHAYFTSLFGGSWTINSRMEYASFLKQYANHVVNDYVHKFPPITTIQTMRAKSLYLTSQENNCDSIPPPKSVERKRTRVGLKSSFDLYGESKNLKKMCSRSLCAADTETQDHEMRYDSLFGDEIAYINENASDAWRHQSCIPPPLSRYQSNANNFISEESNDSVASTPGYIQPSRRTSIQPSTQLPFSTADGQANPSMISIGENIPSMIRTRLFADIDTFWTCNELLADDLALLTLFARVFQCTVRRYFYPEMSESDWKQFGTCLMTRTEPRFCPSHSLPKNFSKNGESYVTSVLEKIEHASLARDVEIDSYTFTSLQESNVSKSRSTSPSSMTPSQSYPSTPSYSNLSSSSTVSYSPDIHNDFSNHLMTEMDKAFEDIVHSQQETIEDESIQPSPMPTSQMHCNIDYRTCAESEACVKAWQEGGQSIYKVGCHLTFPNIVLPRVALLNIRAVVIAELYEKVCNNRELLKNTRMLMHGTDPTMPYSKITMENDLLHLSTIIDNGPMQNGMCRLVFSRKKGQCMRCLVTKGYSNVKSKWYTNANRCIFCGGNDNLSIEEGSDAVNTPFLYIDGNGDCHGSLEREVIDFTKCKQVSKSHIANYLSKNQIIFHYAHNHALKEPTDFKDSFCIKSPCEVIARFPFSKRRLPEGFFADKQAETEYYKKFDTNAYYQKVKEFVYKWVTLTSICYLNDITVYCELESSSQSFNGPMTPVHFRPDSKIVDTTEMYKEQECWCSFFNIRGSSAIEGHHVAYLHSLVEQKIKSKDVKSQFQYRSTSDVRTMAIAFCKPKANFWQGVPSKATTRALLVPSRSIGNKDAINVLVNFIRNFDPMQPDMKLVSLISSEKMPMVNNNTLLFGPENCPWSTMEILDIAIKPVTKSIIDLKCSFPKKMIITRQVREEINTDIATHSSAIMSIRLRAFDRNQTKRCLIKESLSSLQDSDNSPDPHSQSVIYICIIKRNILQMCYSQKRECCRTHCMFLGRIDQAFYDRLIRDGL